MLLALLWPDPCDQNCPQGFKDKAREILAPLPGKVGKTDEDLRKALLKFIGDFADWDRSADPVYLDASRALVKAAHGDEAPLVVDPFAGGGSIPLEALRVGCEAFASDLNPVACLILKVMLEDIPRHGPSLADELRRVGAEIKAAAEKELAEFYPVDPDGARPIAYLWARTVRCEAPNCGAEIPLMRSFWLCKKPNRKRALRYKVIRQDGQIPRVEFEIFEPKSEREVPNGTVTRAKATCLCCGSVLQPERVRAQLTQQEGGADTIFDREGERVGGARLLAVVALKAQEQGRQYRLANPGDYKVVWKAQEHAKKLMSERVSNGLAMIPDEPTPIGGGSGAGRAFSVQKYGMLTFGDLFTARQKLAISYVSASVRLLQTGSIQQHAVKNMMALVTDRCADYWSSLCSWHLTGEKVNHTYGRQALPIVWDFTETCPWCDSSGNFDGAVSWGIKTVESSSGTLSGSGQTKLADAADNPLPAESVAIWFTDPPYYDAVPYADLSDYFLVWLKRALVDDSVTRDPFDPANKLSPKTLEIVQDETKQCEGRPKDGSFYEEAMARSFAEGRRVLMDDAVGSVVFAHKTTEGWEALLSGMIRGGWTITGSWPIATEMGSRLRARDSAALSTSVHLVCRPRPENAPVGDWSDVLRELPKRVGDWMERLQGEYIRGADLVFACIGPALEIFSRYSRVETAEGTEVTLADYLQKVWEVVGRSALEQVLGTAEAQARNGAAGALEEDARLTALFLWTLQSTDGEGEESKKEKVKGKKGDDGGVEEEDDVEDDDEEESGSKGKTKGFSLIFDVARRFAQPLGIHLPEWEGRIIETKKGIVRLLAVSERAEQLFGKEGAQSVAERMEQATAASLQGMLFPEMEQQQRLKVKGGKRRITISDEQMRTRHEATTLDRVHAAMLLQSSGKSNALRALIKEELDRGSDFLRLANALSALYPRSSEEKRLLDAMLLAVPR
jgi:adenine-specific DNA methylase